MNILNEPDIERMVRQAFPARSGFSAAEELGLARMHGPVVLFVHGGTDPFTDSQLERWIEGAPLYVQLPPLLNRLCRDGALAPGQYAVGCRLN